MDWTIILRNTTSLTALGIITYGLISLRAFLYRLAAVDVRRRGQYS